MKWIVCEIAELEICNLVALPCYMFLVVNECDERLLRPECVGSPSQQIEQLVEEARQRTVAGDAVLNGARALRSGPADARCVW